MPNNPIISVIMPVYNAAPYLKEAVEGVIKQTLGAFEFIIIDDASTDGSIELLQSYSKNDGRIILLRNSKNSGIVHCLNIGIQKAKTNYIVRCDADDVNDLERFHIQFEYMEKNPGVAVCGSNAILIDKNSIVIGHKKMPENHDEIINKMMYINPIQHSSAIIRKACLEKLGLYDVRFSLAEDLELWMRLGTKYTLHNLQEDLISYRIADHNCIMVHQKRMILAAIRARFQALRKFGYRYDVRALAFNALLFISLLLPRQAILKLFYLLRKFTV